jgi:ABC-2 type transport system ATP-binding protein
MGELVSSSEAVISVNDLRKTFRTGLFGRRKVQALGGVSLDVPRGQIFGLLGPNGAGKTTLIKILLGIVRKSSGDARILGQKAGEISARRRIGYLPENHRIPRHLTGRTALEFYGCLSGMSVGEARRRTPALIDRVGLKGREKDRVSGYSKGMLQRLGLAQAMLHEPELIVLDEPTDGVDPVGRTEIREVLHGLASDGATVFLNSHLLQEIELICARVAILNEGVVLKSGRVKDLTQSIEGSALAFRVSGDPENVQRGFAEVTPQKITHEEENVVDVRVKLSSQSDVDQLIDRLRAENVSIISIRRHELTLEEAFLQIVKEGK